MLRKVELEIIVPVLVPVPCHGVQDNVPAVCPISGQCVKPPLLTISRNHENHLPVFPAAAGIGQHIPEQRWPAPSAWMCQLKLHQDPVALRSTGTAAVAPEPQQKRSIFRLFSSRKLHRENREWPERQGLRNMLIPQGIKSVIGRYKEVLPGDVCRLVIRRPMADGHAAILVPQVLNVVRLFPPGRKSPTMNGQVLFPRWRQHICRRRVLFHKAFPSTMEPGEVLRGAVCVGDEDGRLEDRHKFRHWRFGLGRSSKGASKGNEAELLPQPIS